MPHEVIMPALGMAQDTGLIVAWHKTAGDKVSTGDVLFEVETDKATMEVEAAGDGYLTNVRAGEGEDVPVGNVIALISETAEGSGDDPAPKADDKPAADHKSAPAPEKAVLPEGHEVIMPALGMAQDTGRIVAWAKAPGDAVAAGDVLFEVETDKATMEVEAAHDGYLAAVLAQEGEDAPVGNVIAVISAEKPEKPVSRSAAQAAPAPAATSHDTPPEPDKGPTEFRRNSDEIPIPESGPSAAPGGRILASPKARRLAAERGLDLTRLAAAGHPQPYHVADLDALAALPAPAAQTAPGAAPATQRIEAQVPRDGLDAFADWLAESGDATPRSAVLAALASGALRGATGRKAVTIRLERPGLEPAAYTDADLTAPTPGDSGEAALILRDLTGSRLTALNLGAADAPVLTVAAQGANTLITLEFSPTQMDAEAAVAVTDGFAARLEDPLRQLF